MEKILKFLTFWAYKVDKKHLKIARANLDLVYKDTISQKRKEEIIYNSYRSLVFNMYEFIENQTISKDELLKKANILNKEIIEKAKINWENQNLEAFPKVVGDDQEYVPLPKLRRL